MQDIWNTKYDWIKTDTAIERVERYSQNDTENINDIYFKLQKAFSGVSYTYADSLENVYKYDLFTGDGYSYENFFNEYDVVSKYLKNYIIVDVASNINVDISQNIYEIDGIKLIKNHVVLLKDQSNQIENGVYVVDEKNYLIDTDYLISKEKSDRFKVSVKYGVVNNGKQFFLHYKNDGSYPTKNESKYFVERHSYIIKHRLTYDIDSIPTNSSNTHKLVFADYDIARKMNNENVELWNGLSINVAGLSNGQTFKIRYYNQDYTINLSNLYDPYSDYIKYDVNTIPTMVDYSSPSGLCFASSEYGNLPSYAAWKAFDGNNSTRWISKTSSDYIGYKFDEPTCIWKYGIYFSEGSLIDRAPKNWIFEASNNIKWYTIDTQYNQTDWSGVTSDIYREYTVNNTIKYYYYRLRVLDTNGASIISIGNFSMYKMDYIYSSNSYKPFVVNDIKNIERLDTYQSSYDTEIKTTSFPDLVINQNDYIDIEIKNNDETYLKFKTFVRYITPNGFTIGDLLPSWVCSDLNSNYSTLTWIVRNVQYTNPTQSGLSSVLNNSFFSKYFNVYTNANILYINPKQCEFNKEFDYGSLSFVYNNTTYKFSTENTYINYNLNDFLNSVSDVVFTPTKNIYNNKSIIPDSQFYVEKDIIQLNSTSVNIKYFKPYTYVNVTGSSNTGRSLILKINESYIWIERPNNFGWNESITEISNIYTLSDISDILYDVYKNENYEYYTVKNDLIRKNICLSYGDILNQNSDIRYYCLGLLYENYDINRNFVLKLYNIQNDDNMLFEVGYRPIEVLDIGIDRKTMLPKPLIYPDFFTYYNNEYNLYGDWNVLDGMSIIPETENLPDHINDKYLYIEGGDDTNQVIVIDDNV